MFKICLHHVYNYMWHAYMFKTCLDHVYNFTKHVYMFAACLQLNVAVVVAQGAFYHSRQFNQQNIQLHITNNLLYNLVTRTAAPKSIYQSLAHKVVIKWRSRTQPTPHHLSHRCLRFQTISLPTLIQACPNRKKNFK